VIPVEVTQTPWHFTTFWDWLDHWQTLIAGVLAFAAGLGTVVAAIWAIWVTRATARKQIDASGKDAREIIAATRDQTETTVRLERERVASEADTLRKSLAVEIRQYIDILIKTREILHRRSGPEKRMRARDLRSVVAFNRPTIYPASADRIGLLGPLAVSVTSFYSTIERLNFTVRFLTNDPEEELVSHADIEAVASLLEQACRTSLPWLSEFPLDERDAEFRATISKWDAERPQRAAM
jgi:hypothetical protein